jgi:hypothetical protein
LLAHQLTSKEQIVPSSPRLPSCQYRELGSLSSLSETAALNYVLNVICQMTCSENLPPYMQFGHRKTHPNIGSFSYRFDTRSPVAVRHQRHSANQADIAKTPL